MSEMFNHLQAAIQDAANEVAWGDEGEYCSAAMSRAATLAVIKFLRKPPSELLEILQTTEPLQVGDSITEYWQTIIDSLFTEEEPTK